MKIKPVYAVCLSTLLLTSCAPVIVGGLATAGYMSVQDRGVKAAFWDTKVKTHIKERLTSKRYQYATEVGVTVIQGRVLLTGVVQNTAAAVEVEKIARAVEGVADVHNELFTDGIYPAEQYSKDTWMGTHMRGRIIGAKDINATNFIISVVNGEAYIMGLTDSASESERVIHIARTTKGITRAHNYVKLIPEGSSSFLGLNLGGRNTSDNDKPSENLFMSN